MLARSAPESGRTADRQLELLGAGQARGRSTRHGLRDGHESQRCVERQNDAVRGEILADRAVVVIVERRVLVRLVLVAGVPMFGVLPAGGQMIVVLAVPMMPMRFTLVRAAICRMRDSVVQRVCVAVMVSTDGVETGVPEQRDRTV